MKAEDKIKSAPGDDDEKQVAAQKYLDHLLHDGCNVSEIGIVAELPSWYNEELYTRGREIGMKYRFILFNGMLSGLIAVLAIPSILKILMQTGQSNTPAMAYRRYVRTIFHIIAWYDYPLIPKSKVWHSLEMVRTKHFMASKNCEKLLGERITQKDLALTQFGFMGFSTLGADKMGINEPMFNEGTVHMWRVLGHLMGIKDEYNLCTDSWATTKLQLEIVMRDVFKPALEVAGQEFNDMTKALIDGLTPAYSDLQWDTAIFITKYMAECNGHEYYKDEQFFGSDSNTNSKHSEYYKLSYFSRFIITYFMFMVNYLHKFNLFRIYINFRIRILEFIQYYWPYGPIFKYGWNWAYVRIFRDDETKYHRD